MHVFDPASGRNLSLAVSRRGDGAATIRAASPAPVDTAADQPAATGTGPDGPVSGGASPAGSAGSTGSAGEVT
jgi:hypothetical protein